MRQGGSRPIPANQNLLQHDRICRAHTQNRQVLVDHVRQEMLRRNGSLDLNVSEDLHMIPAMNHFYSRTLTLQWT
jgi:hypothetical protein